MLLGLNCEHKQQWCAAVVAISLQPIGLVAQVRPQLHTFMSIQLGQASLSVDVQVLSGKVSSRISAEVYSSATSSVWAAAKWHP